jgi:CheY-like chemotaxis protein
VKIYIVEDSGIKVAALKAFLSDEFPEAENCFFGGFQSGLKGIIESPPDVVILDMTIPNFDRGVGRREGKLRPLGGYQIMRKLALRSISFQAIVFTQLETFGEGESSVSFDEVVSMCRNDFPGGFLGCVRYKEGNEEWGGEMKKLLQDVVVSKC